MNFVITMIPITNTELAILSREGKPASVSGCWTHETMKQREFAGQPLVEQSYTESMMPAIFDAIGIDRKRDDRQIAVCLSTQELAAAVGRYQMSMIQSVRAHSAIFAPQCADSVCAALVHWCPHVYITIDRIED